MPSSPPTDVHHPSPPHPPRLQARREASLPKVALIRALQQEAIRRRIGRVYDKTSMAVTGRLLEINPEVVTAWNFRRECIASSGTSSSSSVAVPATKVKDTDKDAETTAETSTYTTPREEDKVYDDLFPLRDELALTERCLRKHPKSYPTWHHRKWTVARLVGAVSGVRGVLGSTPRDSGGSCESHESTRRKAPTQETKQALQAELRLSEKLLTLDDRNFHGWGYRRFVVATLSKVAGRSSDASTDEKYSRSDASTDEKYSIRETESESNANSNAEELKYSTEKIEANFSNYSAWHHRTKYLPLVHGVRVTMHTGYPGAGTTLPTDGGPLTLPTNGGPLTLPTNGGATLPTNGGPLTLPEQTNSAALTLPKRVLDAEFSLVQNAFFTEPEDQAGWMFHRWLTAQTASGDGDGDGDGAVVDNVPGETTGTYEREAVLCRELCDMEPNCKWPVATLQRLTRLAGRDEESEALLVKLQTLDPMRSAYYCDCARVL